MQFPQGGVDWQQAAQQPQQQQDQGGGEEPSREVYMISSHIPPSMKGALGSLILLKSHNAPIVPAILSPPHPKLTPTASLAHASSP